MVMETIEILNNLTTFFSGEVPPIFTLLLFTAIIVIYSVFIYYFYQILAKKNIIELNLNKYNSYASPGLVKFFAFIFYVIEYIIILPILTFFWFAVLSILILLLAEGIGISTILLISAATVASVRVTSYVSQKLSQDLAKLLPFTLLAIAITKPGFFEITKLLSRITEIPTLFSSILYYLIFIIVMELIMRIADATIGFTQSFGAEQEKEED